MKVRVQRKFRDVTEDMKIREPEEILTVTKERGEYLIRLNLAEEIPTPKEKKKNAAE